MDEMEFTTQSATEATGEHTPLVQSCEVSTNGYGSRHTNHLSLPLRAAYALGHVFNDITAAMWFSYTLLFLQMVIGMTPELSGAMLLIGQLTDGICTPIVGIMSDRIGSRKKWHIVGSVFVLLSFPLLFAPCPGCKGTNITTNYWLMALYYAALIAVFQGGWAMVQISHLALLPDLTPTRQGRAELTALRYTASVCSSLAVYVITWSVFRATKGNGLDKIGPDDEFKFWDVVMFGIAIGVTTNSLFHFGMWKVSTHTSRQHTTEQESSSMRRLLSYLRSPALFQVSLLYVTSRLFLTISLVYMPLYLNEITTEGKELLASVPFVCYLSSFLASVGIRHLNSLYGSKLSYLCGAVISISGCVWIRYGMAQKYLIFSIYGVAVLLGAGSSITMVTSLCITADLIGSHTENGAFIYSAVTFADKVLNGIAVMTIEELKYVTSSSYPHYYRDIIAYVCGSSSVLGLIVLISLHSVNTGMNHRVGNNVLGGNLKPLDRAQNKKKLLHFLPNGIKHL